MVLGSFRGTSVHPDLNERVELKRHLCHGGTSESQRTRTEEQLPRCLGTPLVAVPYIRLSVCTQLSVPPPHGLTSARFFFRALEALLRRCSAFRLSAPPGDGSSAPSSTSSNKGMVLSYFAAAHRLSTLSVVVGWIYGGHGGRREWGEQKSASEVLADNTDTCV